MNYEPEKILKMNYLNLNSESTLSVAKALNVLLADYHIYYQRLRNFHWNITGENFFELHEKFEELYGDARMKIDEIAERILTLQYHPESRFSRYIDISNLSETSPLKTDKEMISAILYDHKMLLEQMSNVVNEADKINDEGTIDLIGAYIRELEKTSWMLNAWSTKTANQLKEDLLKA